MVQNAVSTVPGVGKVDVSVVWDPPWDPEPDVGRGACRPQHVVSYLFHPEAPTLRAKFNLLRFETGSGRPAAIPAGIRSLLGFGQTPSG
jgi:hypothetical protein